MDRRGSGVEVGCNGDRNVLRTQRCDGRLLLLAEIIERTRQQHGDRAGCGDGIDIFLIQIFDVIDGQRTIARRHLRSPEVGELFGVELDGQAQSLGRLEHLFSFLHRKGDALAESVDGVGKLLLCDGRQRQFAH